MQIKGNVIKSRIHFVKENFGEEGWKKVLQSLPESDRKILDGILTPIGWYPFEIGKRLDEHIIQVLGQGKSDFFEEIGRASARENLGGVHKDFIRPGDPMEFMNQTPVIYRFYYNVGRREWEATGPADGIITTFDADTFSSADCLTVIGWYKEALEMCGARDVVIEEESCRAAGDDVCRYRVKWSM